MPQLKKPLFKPPVANSTLGSASSTASSSTSSSASSKASKPTPGQKGWLVAVAAASTQESNDEIDVDTYSPSSNSQGSGSNSSKEPGWLLARAEIQENQETDLDQDKGKSQPDSEQSKPEAGRKGWLVSIANSNDDDDDNSQSQPLSNSSQCFSESQDSCKLIIDESSSQEIDSGSNNRGEKGWLVSIAQSGDTPKPNKSKAKRFSMPSSQKSGLGSQEKKKSKRSSLSSFEFFGSQEADVLISNLDGKSLNNNDDASQGSMTSVDAKESNEKVNNKNIDNVMDIQETEVPTPAASEIDMSYVNDSSDVLSKPDLLSIPSGDTLTVPDSISIASSENTEGTSIGSSSIQYKSHEVDPKKVSETKSKKKKKTAKANGAPETATKSKPKSKKSKESSSGKPTDESNSKTSETEAASKEKPKKTSKKSKPDSATKQSIKPSFGKSSKVVSKPAPINEPTDTAAVVPEPFIALPKVNEAVVEETDVLMKDSNSNVESQELIASSISDLISNVVSEVVSGSSLNVSDYPKVAAKKRKIAKKPKSNISNARKQSSSQPPLKKAKLPAKQKMKSAPQNKKVSNDNETRKALLKLQDMRISGTWVMCTRVTCGKWRYLDVKDPSEVNDLFTCSDNPDSKFNECQSPEQLWSKNLNNNIVETRFTVGSLVWARMEGWPSWPGMIDDDPDTGSFFWTEMRGDKWEDKPNSYHVVFFDDKEITRAWVPSARLRKFDSVKPVSAKSKLGARLGKAFEDAMKAADMNLMDRRKEFCLASRFKGPWGPVWPGCGEEESGWYDGPDHYNVEQISQDIMTQNEQDRNMSFIDKSFSCDVLKTVDDMETGDVEAPIAKKSHPLHDVMQSILDVNSDNVIDEQSSSNQGPVARKSKPPTVVSTEAKKSKSKAKKKADKTSSDKENVAPLKENIVAHLYKDKSVFTQNMSETVPQSTYAPSVSFTEGEDLDLFNSSLAREVDQALQVANLFTPIKRSQLGMGSMKSSPAPSSSLTTSTPVRQVVLNSSNTGCGEQWEINKDVANVSGGGDSSNNFDTSAVFD